MKGGRNNWKLGLWGEQRVVKALPESTLCRDFDVLWQGIKIEVKTSQQQMGNSWGFKGIKKGADFFVFLGLNKQGDISCCWLVPRGKMYDGTLRGRKCRSMNPKSGRTAKFLIDYRQLAKEIYSRLEKSEICKF